MKIGNGDLESAAQMLDRRFEAPIGLSSEGVAAAWEALRLINVAPFHLKREATVRGSFP
jgi:hypothetical protein